MEQVLDLQHHLSTGHVLLRSDNIPSRHKEEEDVSMMTFLISEFLKMLWDISRTKTSEIQKKRRIPLLGTVSAHRFALRWQLNEKETRNGMKHGNYMRCCLGELCRNYFQQQLETLVGQPTLMDYISTYQVSFYIHFIRVS